MSQKVKESFEGKTEVPRDVRWQICGQFCLYILTAFSFLCRLRSITAHRDTLCGVCLSVHVSVCLSGSHTFLVVTQSYVSQATHAFLEMLPICYFTLITVFMVCKIHDIKWFLLDVGTQRSKLWLKLSSSRQMSLDTLFWILLT